MTLVPSGSRIRHPFIVNHRLPYVARDATQRLCDDESEGEIQSAAATAFSRSAVEPDADWRVVKKSDAAIREKTERSPDSAFAKNEHQHFAADASRM
jgi:hypothetical protein